MCVRRTAFNCFSMMVPRTGLPAPRGGCCGCWCYASQTRLCEVWCKSSCRERCNVHHVGSYDPQSWYRVCQSGMTQRWWQRWRRAVPIRPRHFVGAVRPAQWPCHPPHLGSRSRRALGWCVLYCVCTPPPIDRRVAGNTAMRIVISQTLVWGAAGVATLLCLLVA